MPRGLAVVHGQAAAELRIDGVRNASVFGSEILLHAEPPGCFDPIPLAPRPRPPASPPRMDLRKETGYFYVALLPVASSESVHRGNP